MDAKIKHLEFIQAVIARMSGNLFYLRGWTVTLVAALFALAAKDANTKYAIVAYVPLLVFWTLDGYFLSQERQYRSLYNDVRLREERQIDFSLDTRVYLKDAKNHWFPSMFSPTLLFFYVPLIALTTFVLVAIKTDQVAPKPVASANVSSGTSATNTADRPTNATTASTH